MIRLRPMNEGRQSRIDYRRSPQRDKMRARMPAARHAAHALPLRIEQEGSEVLAYLRKRS